MFETSRRRLLRRVGTVVGSAGVLGAVASNRARASARTDDPTRGVGRASRRAPRNASTFDPARDAFGFRNWAVDNGVYGEHHHETVSEREIQATIRSSWRKLVGDDLGVKTWSNAFVRGIARQLYVSVNQQTASNGHCFGMAFATQQYAEKPETLPLSAETASELKHPAAPVEDPSREPAGELIDLYHNTQTLNPWSWIGRRKLGMPKRIDVGRETEALQAAIDEFGTATLTLVELGNRNFHQVLVYGYRTQGSTVEFLVYDPNFPASYYTANELTIDVDTGRTPAQMVPFRNYDRFVFSRHDRRLLESGTSAALVIGQELADWLSRLVMFLVDSDDLDLVVRDPNGKPVERDTARVMNRDPTEFSRVRYRYGAPSGEYRVAIVGRAKTSYNLSALAADRDGSLIDAERGATIDPGDTHEYVATIPESSNEPASIRRDHDDASGLVTLGVGTLSAGAGAAAYRYYRRT